MVGRFPLAIINIQIDPYLADVNVHPTKQEVRISKERELMALISQAIAKRFERAGPDSGCSRKSSQVDYSSNRKTGTDDPAFKGKTASIMTERVKISNFDQKWQILNGL